MDRQGAFAIFASVLARHGIRIDHSVQQELIAAALTEALQGLSGKTTNVLSFHDQTRGKQPNIVLRYRLRKPEDRRTMQALSPSEIVSKLRGYGVQWEKLCGVQVKEKVLELDLESSATESDVREHGEDIAKAFELDPTCGFAAPEHLVYIEGVKVPFNYDVSKYQTQYGQAANIRPRGVFAKNGRVVLDFATPEDANKVRQGLIYIDNERARVQPFDRRSVATFCSFCSAPGHRTQGTRCSRDVTCGICAEAHLTTDCDSMVNEITGKSPQFGPGFKCANCSKDHPVWSNACRGLETVRMRKRCLGWEVKGPAWALQPAPKQGNEGGGGGEGGEGGKKAKGGGGKIGRPKGSKNKGKPGAGKKSAGRGGTGQGGNPDQKDIRQCIKDQGNKALGKNAESSQGTS